MRPRFGGGIRSIVGNGARWMGISWVEAALGAVYFAVMARLLGPALYGHWAYGVAAYTLVVGLAGFGLDALILLRLGEGKEDAGGFVGLTLFLRLAFLGLGAAGLAAYALAAETDPLSRMVLLLLVPALLGRGVAYWARVCFLGYERMTDYARFVALFRGAEAGCGILYLLMGGGLLGVVALHSLSWLAEAGFGLGRIRARLTRYRLRFAGRPALDLLAQGAALGVAAAGWTWFVSGPVMILRHSGLGMAPIGQFAIVLSLTMILVGSAHAFFGAALPVLSRTAGRTSPRMAAYGRLTVLAAAVAACAAAAVGRMLGPPVAVWVLGARYAVAGGLLAPFLLIGGLILAPTGYEQTLLLSGRRWPLALAYVAGGLWLAGALAPAAAAWGLEGAVMAMGGAWLIRAALLIAIGEFYAARNRRLASG